MLEIRVGNGLVVRVPVYASDYAALREWRRGLVLPEAVVAAVALIGLIEGVVEGRDEQDDVGEACGDFVEQNRLVGELLAAREGVAGP